MKKSKMNFILAFAATALMTCNLIACNNNEVIEETEEIVETEEIENIGDKVSKIGECLSEQVPEIADWEEYVARKSEGKAFLYQSYNNVEEDVYRDGEGSEYLGKYYLAYVGESWDDHSVMWSCFYVSVNYDEVLWKDAWRLKGSEHETYTLEEWRNSPWYPSTDE